MMEWYSWFVVAHIVGAFAFILAHGASVFVAFQLKRERRPDHVATLLGLSSSSMSLMYIGLVVLLVGGIGAGIIGDWWGRWWIWASIGLLLAIATAMYAVGTRYYIAVRRAVGVRSREDPKSDPPPVAVSPEELDVLLTSRRPEALALIGGVGLIAIIWLMVIKPG